MSAQRSPSETDSSSFVGSDSSGSPLNAVMSAVASPSACLTFKDLSFSAKMPKGERQVILEPCSGHFEAGELVAIMGPSGCGKTTLLDMLAMKKTAAYSGQVLVNGNERNPTLFPRIAAYVDQEDRMPAHWKVREALEFNAALKLPPGAGASRPQRAAGGLIDHLLEAFGLTGVAESYIGSDKVRGISGGQRRRVTLARGVASQASILFCDEPTSGLSAADAALCVKALREIAKRMNVLTLVVIHQPRRLVAELFDTLVLLTSNPGRMAYFGSMELAPTYIENCGYPLPTRENPADFFLDLLTPGSDLDASDALVTAFNAKQKPDLDKAVKEAMAKKGHAIKEMVRAAYQQSLQGKTSAATAKKLRVKPYAVSFGAQLGVLLKRRVRLTMRDLGAVGMQIGMPIAFGFIWGLLFGGIGTKAFGVQTLLFVFIVLLMISLQSLPLMQLLIDERTIMKRETSERLYTEGAHILSGFLVTVPLCLLGATLQILIIYAFSQLPLAYLPTVVGWVLLLFLTFDGMFSAVAAAAPNGNQAMIVAVPFLAMSILFNGMVISRASAPPYLLWVFEVSPMRYALQAIMLRLSEDATEGEKAGVMRVLGFTPGEDVKGVVVIVCMLLFFRAVQILCTKYMHNLQK